MKLGFVSPASGEASPGVTALYFSPVGWHTIYEKYNATMKQSLGPLERRLFAWTQLRRQRTVRTGELLEPLGLTALQERELFRRLARGGMIARVRPGLYLVPERLPLGGAWSPGEALALATLMADRGGRYQVTGPRAFNFHGFDSQVAQRSCAYNDRISGRRRIGAIELDLVRVAGDRLGDTVEVATAEGVAAIYSSRARTLIDAVYDWSRFDGLPRAYDWIRAEVGNGRVRADELARLAVRYGDVATRRRLGALLEREGAAESASRRLERTLARTSSTIPWIPGRPKRGSVDRRWGVVWNERERA